MQQPRRAARALMLSVLLMLNAGCWTATAPQVVQAPIPPLPAPARQPQAQAMCLPSCSAAVSVTFDAWLQPPTSAAPPGRPASGPTMR